MKVSFLVDGKPHIGEALAVTTILSEEFGEIVILGILPKGGEYPIEVLFEDLIDPPEGLIETLQEMVDQVVVEGSDFLASQDLAKLMLDKSPCPKCGALTLRLITKNATLKCSQCGRPRFVIRLKGLFPIPEWEQGEHPQILFNLRSIDHRNPDQFVVARVVGVEDNNLVFLTPDGVNGTVHFSRVLEFIPPEGIEFENLKKDGIPQVRLGSVIGIVKSVVFLSFCRDLFAERIKKIK